MMVNTAIEQTLPPRTRLLYVIIVMVAAMIVQNLLNEAVSGRTSESKEKRFCTGKQE